MKHNYSFIHTMTSLVALAIGALFAASCGKDPEAPHNPTEEQLAGKPFNISITEVRQSKTFTWDVDAAGITDNHEESIKDLYATKYNTVTLKATEDVNVKAAEPAIVSVTRVDPKTYTLEYKGDGKTMIQVWNGEGSGKVEKRFSIRGQECVDITGVKFLWYKFDKEARVCSDDIITITHFKTTDFIMGQEAIYYSGPNGSIADREQENDLWFDSDYGIWDWVFTFDEEGRRTGSTHYGHDLTFLGFEPENTSFREIIDFESEWKRPWSVYNSCVKNGEFNPNDYNWPDNKNIKKDVSELIGVKCRMIGVNGTPFYVAKISVKADVKRYYYMYHRQDGCSREIDKGIHGQ